MKYSLIVPALLALASVCFAQQTHDERREIPAAILQNSREIPADRVLFPVPHNRIEAVKHFEKNKTAGEICVLDEAIAKDLVGGVYSNPDERVPILVRWFYLEEDEINLKQLQASSATPVVRIDGDTVYVQARHHDISNKGKKIACPIIVLVDKAPDKAILYSQTFGW